MVLPELLREIENRGVILEPAGDRLRFRPKRNLTPELLEGLREHKAAILEALEGCEKLPQNFAEVYEVPGQNFDSAKPVPNLAPVIESIAGVLELARAHFGEIAPESRQEAPYAAPEPGRDPLAHKHTDKALWFAGARERELERRRRHGLPSYIRIVDGGAS
ncbi:MAG: hypothetical protein M3Q60_19245 [Actinomycetota bacterium]|nr:hypothetical protein [Actinomycetota bacterium]